VTDNGLGVGMQVVGVGINHAFVAQVIKAVRAKVVGIAIQQVAAQAVYGDL